MAPVDGIVISRNVDVGQTVAASMQAPTLFVIAKDLTRMQVNASIDEADIGRIAHGPAGVVPCRRVSARDLHRHRVASAARSGRGAERRQLRDRDRRAEQGAEAEAGMTANVTVEIARADDVLRVPNGALRFRPDGATAGRMASARLAVRQLLAEGAAGECRRTDAARAGGRRGGRACGCSRTDSCSRCAVQVGITDGTTTAIAGGELTESAQVVTGIGAARTGVGAAVKLTAAAVRRPWTWWQRYTHRAPAGGQRTGAGR